MAGFLCRKRPRRQSSREGARVLEAAGMGRGMWVLLKEEQAFRLTEAGPRK